MSQALLLGVALSVAALAYVFYPLVHPPRRSAPTRRDAGATRAVTDEELDAAIRSYRDGNGLGTEPVCPVCGRRPESDARFCSNCGRQLDAASSQ